MAKITVSTAHGIASFRRAGFEFGREGVELDTDKLQKGQLEAIQAEPRLVVAAVVDDGDKKKSSKKD